MRYAIISDIHSNLEALQAVLRDCQKKNVQALVCGGDIVGYGANPKECLEVVQSLEAPCVAGNHDWAVSGRLDASYFTSDGKEAVSWTQTQIDFSDINYLNSLKLIYKCKDFTLVHASLHQPEAFTYLNKTEKTLASFDVMDQSICFVGHTHTPRIYMQRDGEVSASESLQIDIEPKTKYIVNVGSVGQPRDDNADAAYCLFDPDINLIAIQRVSYNIESAQKKILDAGLPKSLAQRLSIGQ